MKEPTPWSGCPLQSGGKTQGMKGMSLRGNDDAQGEQVAPGEETGTP